MLKSVDLLSATPRKLTGKTQQKGNCMKKAAILVCVLSVSSSIFAVEIHCPKKLEGTEQTLKIPISGWESYYDDQNSPQILERVGFYEGDIKENFQLTPADQTKNQDVFQFFPKNNNPIWLSCSYLNTKIKLIKMLPQGSRRCVVEYGPEKLVPKNISSIRCN
jgi:hypothetical protein